MAIRHVYGAMPALCVDTDVHVLVTLWNLWLDDGIM